MSDPHVVVITGTRKGIGRHLSEYFVARGDLVEGCSRGPAEWSHERYVHHEIDVTDEQQVKTMLSAIHRRHGRIDVLINNAGIASMNHILLTPTATVERIMGTNFLGTFLLCRECAKLMQRRNYGRIVNFSTIAVPLALEGEAVYAASKSAVETFSRALAREVGNFGITCNVIGPTPVETDLIRAVPPAKIQKLVDGLAIKRLGNFDDITNLVEFLVRPASEYITGQVIYLGGIS